MRCQAVRQSLLVCKGIDFIRPLSWAEVYKIWEGNEAHLKHWESHARQRGFSTWREWRETFFRRFKCSRLSWGLYVIQYPKLSIPDFRGGPFRGWTQLFYQGQTMPSFRQLSHNKDLQKYEGLKGFMDNFPETTTFIGLAARDDIFIIEGMHRCAAVAVDGILENKIEIKSVTIALADFSFLRLYFLQKMVEIYLRLNSLRPH